MSGACVFVWPCGNGSCGHLRLCYAIRRSHAAIASVPPVMVGPTRMRRHRRGIGRCRWLGSDSAGRVAGLVRVAWCLRTSRHAVPRHGHQRRWMGGCARRRLHNFVAASVVKTPDVSHRLGSLCHAPVSSRACWPNHRFGVLLGSRENLRGRPARVRRPAVGSPKELARGNWHASTHGCAVTGARTKVVVGTRLVTCGARKWGCWGWKGGDLFLESCCGVQNDDRVCARAGGR